MKRDCLFIILLTVLPLFTYSQERNFNISGYIDAAFGHIGRHSESIGDTALVETDGRFTFLTQRYNVLPSSEFGRFKVFANIEFRNAFSTETNTGSFQLFEAWIQYTFSNDLRIRSGILTPTFGAFNAIRDASPTFLGVLPPSVFDEAFEPVEFLPEFANLMISGSPDFGGTQFEYSFFVGNGHGIESETSTDLNNDKSFGGRIGVVPTENLKLGVSAWNSGVETGESNIHRHELYGFDILLTEGEFELRSEVMPGRDIIDGTPYYKFTHFVSIAYTFGGEVTPYILYDYLRSENDLEYSHIQHRWSAGINYKPLWRTALKAEVIRDSYSRPGLIDHWYILVGASVLF